MESTDPGARNMTAATEGNSHAPTPSPGGSGGNARRRAGTLILGHRGSPREAPENTLRSFDLALQSGADGVELDVRPSRDGVAVIAHDDLLQVGKRARRRISRLDWPAIQRLTEAAVPCFEQVVAWAAASGAWLNVEIKATGVEDEVVARVRETGVAERVIVSSFEAEVVRRVGAIDSGIVRYYLTKTWDEPARRRLDLAGAAGVCLRDDAATATALAELHDRGFPVIVWTVNDRARIRDLVAAGVAGIISDDPAMAAGVRRELGDA